VHNSKGALHADPTFPTTDVCTKANAVGVTKGTATVVPPVEGAAVQTLTVSFIDVKDTDAKKAAKKANTDKPAPALPGVLPGTISNTGGVFTYSSVENLITCSATLVKTAYVEKGKKATDGPTHVEAGGDVPKHGEVGHDHKDGDEPKHGEVGHDHKDGDEPKHGEVGHDHKEDHKHGEVGHVHTEDHKHGEVGHDHKEGDEPKHGEAGHEHKDGDEHDGKFHLNAWHYAGIILLIILIIFVVYYVIRRQQAAKLTESLRGAPQQSLLAH